MLLAIVDSYREFLAEHWPEKTVTFRFSPILSGWWLGLASSVAPCLDYPSGDFYGSKFVQRVGVKVFDAYRHGAAPYERLSTLECGGLTPLSQWEQTKPIAIDSPRKRGLRASKWTSSNARTRASDSRMFVRVLCRPVTSLAAKGCSNPSSYGIAKRRNKDSQGSHDLPPAFVKEPCR